MSMLKFGAYLVKITNEDKIFFPDNITKGDLVTYYKNIAPVMLKYLKNRPVMMHRFPDGIDGESFYQKDASDYFPKWIKQVLVEKKAGYNNFVVCQNQATLVYIANQACITFHIWLSKIDMLDYPDKMIFDLDPSPGNTFNQVCKAALELKDLLENLNLKSFVMSTGSKGLHVVVPLDRNFNFDQVKNCAQDCARILVNNNTNLTMAIQKEKRGKKIFIDTLRNQYSSTSVAPYSVRAIARAPVATPLYWDELLDKSLSAQKYNINNIFSRLSSVGDAFKDIHKSRQSLKKARILLDDILTKI